MYRKERKSHQCVRSWVNFHRAGTPWIQRPDQDTELSGTPGAPGHYPIFPVGTTRLCGLRQWAPAAGASLGFVPPRAGCEQRAVLSECPWSSPEGPCAGA